MWGSHFGSLPDSGGGVGVTKVWSEQGIPDVSFGVSDSVLTYLGFERRGKQRTTSDYDSGEGIVVCVCTYVCVSMCTCECTCV